MSRATVIFLATLLAGCLAPGTSDASRAWNLPSAEQVGPKVRVFLPTELRTPRVVAGDAVGTPVARDLDRWSVPLHTGLEELISERLLIGLSIRDVVVEFRMLRVDAGGNCRVIADYRANTWSFVGGPDVEIKGIVIAEISGISGESERERIVQGYVDAARTVANRIREDYEQQGKGEVAKPPAPVSVPGK